MRKRTRADCRYSYKLLFFLFITLTLHVKSSDALSEKKSIGQSKTRSVEEHGRLYRHRRTKGNGIKSSEITISGVGVPKSKGSESDDEPIEPPTPVPEESVNDEDQINPSITPFPSTEATDAPTMTTSTTTIETLSPTMTEEESGGPSMTPTRIIETPAPSPANTEENDVGGLLTPAPTIDDTTSPTTDSVEGAFQNRQLFPFSLDIESEEAPVMTEVDQVLEDYLLTTLLVPFANLESINLSTTQSSSTNEGRKLRRYLQDGTRYSFEGDAVFVSDEVMVPEEEDVHQAQRNALEDFDRLNEFLFDRGYSWQVGRRDESTGEEDSAPGALGSLERGAVVEEDSGSNAAAISLSLVAIVTVASLAAFFVYKKKRKASEELSDPAQKLQAIEDANMSLDNDLAEQTHSYSVTAASLDSINVSGGRYESNQSSSSVMDWNRVFALSMQPVEKTFHEVFEAKTVDPPKAEKTKEVVTLAPLNENKEEDSYGYDHATDAEIDISLPGSIDEYAGEDRDLTIDLGDFAIEGESDKCESDDDDQ